MATVFKRGDFYSAKVRLWDGRGGKFVWKQVATHCKGEAEALLVAGVLERGAGLAKAGQLSRDKALGMVNDLLRFAGLESLEVCPGTFAFAESICDADGLAFKTRQKYEGNLNRFKKWAGKDRPLDGWTTTELQAYYDTLLELSPGTAAAHLRFLRTVWNRAQKLGHVRINPAAGVRRRRVSPIRKEGFTRGEVAQLLWTLRREGQAGWLSLVLMGWHTGHRIADLLALTPADFEERGGIPCVLLQPEKKINAGGRLVVLPLPRYLWRRCVRLGGTLRREDGGLRVNNSGKVSNQFVEWLVQAGVDPQPVQSAARVMHLLSFHSFRHSMASRLTAAGVSGEVARLVTDHSSVKVHQAYVHAEVQALAAALRAVRGGQKKTAP